MHIPAMDAVDCKRVGIINGDEFTVAGVFYDQSVSEDDPASDMFKMTRPLCVVTTEPIAMETVMASPNQFERVDFSEEFWTEADKLYRTMSNESQEEMGNERFLISAPMESNSNGMGEFESNFLSNIHHILPSVGPSHEIWNHIIKESHFSQLRERDTTLTGKPINDFSESDFSEQMYVPDFEFVEDWGLYNYSYMDDDISMWSIWLRYESLGGDISEIPLIEYSDGHLSILSTNPDFSGVEDEHISSEFAEALEDEGPTEEQDLTSLEKTILNEIQGSSMDLPENTKQIFNKATESNPVTKE